MRNAIETIIEFISFVLSTIWVVMKFIGLTIIAISLLICLFAGTLVSMQVINIWMLTT
jgi:hypothetical protein